MGMSVEDLAKALEMSNQNIESIESDKAIPTRDIIIEIQEALQTDIVLDARRLKVN